MAAHIAHPNATIEEHHVEAFKISETPFISLPPQRHAHERIDELLTRLETISCTEIRTQAISYGIIFTGFYRGIGFEFNVYVNGQGRLDRKTRHIAVWYEPVTPPDMLRDEIDEVIQWIKSIYGTGDVMALWGHLDRDRR